MQGESHICKTVTDHVTRLKKKKYLRDYDPFRDSEEVLDKIQHPFIIKKGSEITHNRKLPQSDNKNPPNKKKTILEETSHSTVNN